MEEVLWLIERIKRNAQPFWVWDDTPNGATRPGCQRFFKHGLWIDNLHHNHLMYFLKSQMPGTPTGLWRNERTGELPGLSAPCGDTQLVGVSSHKLKEVEGSILGQGTCLGCRFGDWLGHVQQLIDVSLPLSLPPFFFLKSISMSSGKDKKINKELESLIGNNTA